MALTFTGAVTLAGAIQATGSGYTPPAAAANDPYFMYNTLLLSGDGTNLSQNNTFVDSSTNNFAITRNGNTTQGTFSPYGSNWSNYFDGTGDYLTVGTSANLSVSTSDFTIEAWVYLNSGSAYQYVLGATGNGGMQVGLNVPISGTPTIALATANVAWILNFGASITIPTATWTHIAITRSGSTNRAFINGVQLGSNITDSTNWTFPNNSLQVGATMGIEVFGGYISNLRVVKGTAVYTSAFTPSTTPLTAITNTTLLTCQSNRLIDNSTNNLTVTKNGDTSIQRFSPFAPSAAYSAATIGGSGYFDGTGDYLSAGSNSAFAVGTGDFTFQVYVYPTAYTSPVGAIIDTGSSVASGRFSVVLYANGILRVDSNANLLSSSSALPLNQWTFISIIRSSGTMTMYFNGTSVASGSITNNFTETQSLIGKTIDNHHFQGYISNLRLVKGTALANTVPTAPLTAVANTQLLLSNTNAGITDSAMINNLETVGNAKISTTQSKFGGSSMAFDGTGDYLTQPNSQNFNFGTGNFTMEGWFYQTGLSSSYPGIVSNPLGWGNAGAWSVLSSHASSGVRKLQFHCYNADASNPLLLGTTTLSDNTWYYFAVTRSGTTFRLFLNGIIEATATFSGAVTSTSSGLVVGINQTAYPFQGYIDDVRITKDVARYTATFTPPTAALPTY